MAIFAIFPCWLNVLSEVVQSFDALGVSTVSNVEPTACFLGYLGTVPFSKLTKKESKSRRVVFFRMKDSSSRVSNSRRRTRLAA